MIGSGDEQGFRTHRVGWGFINLSAVIVVGAAVTAVIWLWLIHRTPRLAVGHHNEAKTNGPVWP